MKPFIISAVSLALCLLLGTPIYSMNTSTSSPYTTTKEAPFMCYYCPEPTASGQCSDTKVCKGPVFQCITTLESDNVGFPFDGTEVVTRGCGTSSSCAMQSNDDDLGDTKAFICCNTPLCNYQGLYANSSAILAHPDIGMYAIGISVAVITIRL